MTPRNNVSQSDGVGQSVICDLNEKVENGPAIRKSLGWGKMTLFDQIMKNKKFKRTQKIRLVLHRRT